MFLWKVRHPDIVIANFYDLAPHMLLATCGVFSMAMLLESYITKLKWLNWIFMKISNYTFSIYMIHGFILISYVNSHESAAQTVKGTITEVLFVFFKCLIFVVIFDNLITFNIQRLIYFVTDKVSKLVKRLPFAKRQES